MNKKVFITGGTGTLGHAIVHTAVTNNHDWDITIFSRDFLKQAAMRKQYPQCNYIVGDICDYEGLYAAMVGHDLVIHAAAQKHIPAGEQYPLDTARVNINGSQNVAMAAVTCGVHKVIGISTDKVCTPTSLYGMSKAFMERMYIKYAEQFHGITEFSMCRYGNVLGSNGSVLQVWERQEKKGNFITITDPAMTRFWLSKQDAVNLVLGTIKMPTGTVLIPKAPACSMEELANALYPDIEHVVIGRRPGEKDHEVLLDIEEIDRCLDLGECWLMTPDHVGELEVSDFENGYRSDDAVEKLDSDTIWKMLED